VASSPLPAIPLQPPEESKRGLVSLVLLFVLPAAIFAALVAYSQLERTSTIPQQGTPGSLVWGDGTVIFSNKQQLAAWLRLHGSSYSTFVKRHPGALRLVSAPPTKAAAQTTTRVASPTHPAAKPEKTAAAKPETTAKPTASPTVTITGPAASKPGPRTLVFSIAAVLALLLGCFALLPRSVVNRFGIRGTLDRQRDLRFSAGAISIAILAGVGVGVLVG
jgi:hypothetical protein